MKLRLAGSESSALTTAAPTGQTLPGHGAKRSAVDPLTGLPLRPSLDGGPRPSRLVHPKRALGVHSFPCEVSAAQMRNRAQLAIESNDTSAVAVCWLQARDLADKELKLAKGTAAVSVALPPMALGLLPMAGTIGRHRKTERLCWEFLARHCSTDQLIAVQSMDFKDKDIAGRLRTAFPESVSSSVAHSVVPSQLQETAAAQAAAELDRIGSKDLSGPTEMKNLPAQLRDSLIREMAGHFSNLWGNSDPGLSTPKKAIETLKEMAADPTVVFQAQYNRQGRLVSTSTIVDRDEPAFSDTGPGGTDRYGDHWVANVFTSPEYRGNGHATAQITALQGIAVQRGWPHLWLYCRDQQDGVDLPKYYHDKLGFQKAREELVDDDGKMEKENIMRFDTGVKSDTVLLKA